MEDSCREFQVTYIKLGASKFRLNKKGKVIDYDAGQNKCFWHQDNITFFKVKLFARNRNLNFTFYRLHYRINWC